MLDVILLLYFLPIIIVTLLFARAVYNYFKLYRKKKNPDYPILFGEAKNYLHKGSKYFLKIYLTPFYMWKIIFEKHRDKELNKAANKVRLLFFLYIILIVFEIIIPF